MKRIITVQIVYNRNGSSNWQVIFCFPHTGKEVIFYYEQQSLHHTYRSVMADKSVMTLTVTLRVLSSYRDRFIYRNKRKFLLLLFTISCWGELCVESWKLPNSHNTLKWNIIDLHNRNSQMHLFIYLFIFFKYCPSSKGHGMVPPLLFFLPATLWGRLHCNPIHVYSKMELNVAYSQVMLSKIVAIGSDKPKVTQEAS